MQGDAMLISFSMKLRGCTLRSWVRAAGGRPVGAQQPQRSQTAQHMPAGCRQPDWTSPSSNLFQPRKQLGGHLWRRGGGVAVGGTLAGSALAAGGRSRHDHLR
jgi:hypothetical protein